MRAEYQHPISIKIWFQGTSTSRNIDGVILMEESNGIMQIKYIWWRSCRVMNKRKRHINEFRHTSLANSGRAAGAGILYDRYDEESGLPYRGGSVRMVTPADFMTKEQRAALNGPVIVKKLKDIEEEKHD